MLPIHDCQYQYHTASNPTSLQLDLSDSNSSNSSNSILNNQHNNNQYIQNNQQDQQQSNPYKYQYRYQHDQQHNILNNNNGYSPNYNQRNKHNQQHQQLSATDTNDNMHYLDYNPIINSNGGCTKLNCSHTTHSTINKVNPAIHATINPINTTNSFQQSDYQHQSVTPVDIQSVINSKYPAYHPSSALNHYDKNTLNDPFDNSVSINHSYSDNKSIDYRNIPSISAQSINMNNTNNKIHCNCCNHYDKDNNHRHSQLHDYHNHTNINTNSENTIKNNSGNIDNNGVRSDYPLSNPQQSCLQFMNDITSLHVNQQRHRDNRNNQINGLPITTMSTRNKFNHINVDNNVPSNHNNHISNNNNSVSLPDNLPPLPTPVPVPIPMAIPSLSTTLKTEIKDEQHNKLIIKTSTKNTKEFNRNLLRRFECTECGKKYKHLCNLKSHYKVHTDEAIVCPHCSKKFGRKANYKEHLRIHTGETPYKCNYCQRQFKHHHSWKDHLRIHTGEKPYECHVCLKKFKVGHNLTVHLRIHTGEKPYSCTICCKSFRQKSAINSHIKRAHKKKK